MADLASEASGLDTRHRFMLLDIIQLRKDRWELRGALATTAVQAKTIAQVRAARTAPTRTLTLTLDAHAHAKPSNRASTPTWHARD